MFNHDMKGASGVNAATYLGYMQGVAKHLGLNPDRVTGMVFRQENDTYLVA